MDQINPNQNTTNHRDISYNFFCHSCRNYILPIKKDHCDFVCQTCNSGGFVENVSNIQGELYNDFINFINNERCNLTSNNSGDINNSNNNDNSRSPLQQLIQNIFNDPNFFSNIVNSQGSTPQIYTINLSNSLNSGSRNNGGVRNISHINSPNNRRGMCINFIEQNGRLDVEVLPHLVSPQNNLLNLFQSLNNLDVLNDQTHNIDITNTPFDFSLLFGDGLLNTFDDQIMQQIIGRIMQNDPNRYGSPPAAAHVIQNLKPENISYDEARVVGPCAICQEDYKENDTIHRLSSDNSKCPHIFHPDCIIPWLQQHNSCPVCRFELPTDDPEYESRRQQLLPDAARNPVVDCDSEVNAVNSVNEIVSSSYSTDVRDESKISSSTSSQSFLNPPSSSSSRDESLINNESSTPFIPNGNSVSFNVTDTSTSNDDTSSQNVSFASFPSFSPSSTSLTSSMTNSNFCSSASFGYFPISGMIPPSPSSVEPESFSTSAFTSAAFTFSSPIGSSNIFNSFPSIGMLNPLMQQFASSMNMQYNFNSIPNPNSSSSQTFFYTYDSNTDANSSSSSSVNNCTQQ